MEEETIHENIIKSYGAMTTILSYLEQFQVLSLQRLSSYMYFVGIQRIQTKIKIGYSFSVHNSVVKLCQETIVNYDVRTKTLSEYQWDSSIQAKSCAVI